MKSTEQNENTFKQSEEVLLKLNSFFDLISTTEESRQKIFKILVSLDAEILKDWLNKLQTKNGKLAGTYYEELAKVLSFRNFVALYEALGYNFEEQGHWMNMWCYGSQGCVSQKGYTCSPQTCFQT
jgi:hypothetical protein